MIDAPALGRRTGRRVMRLLPRWPEGRTIPLRLLLALAFGGLGFVATLTLAALVHADATRRLEAEIGAQLEELAGHMARSLDQGMFERWRDLKVAASSEALRDPAKPVAAKREALERLQRTFPAYSILLFADPTGRIVATSNGLIEGADIARRDYFRAGRERPFVGDVHDAVLLAKVLPRDHAEPLRLVDFSAPVQAANGALAGVIAAHLDWNWAREVAKSFEQSLRGYRTGAEVLVLARDGTVLIGPAALSERVIAPGTLNGARAAADATASRIGRWPDAEGEMLFAQQKTQGHRDYPGLGWTVVARHRADTALSSVSALSRRIALVGGLVGLCAGLLAWLLADRIARPLEHLALAATALGRDAPLPERPWTPIREAHAIGLALDDAAMELGRREAARRLLIDELNHRVKNTLATVQSLAAQSFRGSGEAADGARSRFEGRLLALSAAHDILTRECWAGADLRTIAAEVVRPYEGEAGSRTELDGPEVRLSPGLALSLSMILHELGTNAAKYGALSKPTGRVSLTWQRQDSHLHIVWRETGGPSVRPPERRGFGSRLIERGLSAELGGTAWIDYRPEGVVCEVNARLLRGEGAAEPLARAA